MMKEINAKNVAKWYIKGYWTMDMVNDAVLAGKLTEAEAEKISKLPKRGVADGISG